MRRKKNFSSRAEKPRLRRAVEVIRSIREKRGKNARGDFLLQQAQDSLSANDVRCAKLFLKKFETDFASTVLNEQHAAIRIVRTKFLAHRKWKFAPRSILNLLNLLVEIAKLVRGNLQSCYQFG